MYLHLDVGQFRLPLEQVNTRIARWLSLFCLLAGPFLAAPSQAQIISIVDESGKRIYINWAPPQPVRRAASSRPATTGRTAAPTNVALASRTSAPAERPRVTKAEIERFVQIASERYRVDPALVRAVITHESGWNPHAVSRAGAQGLMQLMPATAERHGVADAFDPEQNINAGVRHLRSLLERYRGDLDLALAAYNAGEGAVDRAGGVPNIRETRTYVNRVTNTYFQPGSGRASSPIQTTRGIYRIIDSRGKVIYTNE